jgi:hypothetical protein
MNIQQYYRSAANIALNGSLAAFVPMILIQIGSMYFSAKLPLMIIVLPFCLYSFICFQGYLIQHHRSLESKVKQPVKLVTLSNAENILLTFMPAPSLRMLLFEPNGNLIGEIRDKRFWWWRWFLPYFIDRVFPRNYSLYDQTNKILATYRVNKGKRQIKVYDSQQNEMGFYIEQWDTSFSLKKRGVIHSLTKNKDIHVEGSAIYPEVQFRNQEQIIISKMIKGWMPNEWEKQFRDPNTPIIVFDKQMDEHEKILAFGVLAGIFQSTSH